MDYKTPQTTFREAINFDDAGANGESVDKTSVRKSISSLHAKFNNLMRRLNNSEYIYPTISVLAMTLLAILFIFNHNVSVIIKCLVVIILLLFIVYTVYQYRYK